MSKLMLQILLVVLLTSCDTEKTIYVAPKLVDCESTSSQKCLQVKENIEDEWTLFYDQIEGFDYKEGYTYKLDVIVSKIKNPPADGSSLKYTLKKLIYKEASKEKVSSTQSISGSWKVDKMIGMNSLTKAPTLKFSNGKISGDAGCNNYSANYTEKEGVISIGLAMATKRYCTDMKVEDTFFSCLKKAATYKLENGLLKLYDSKNNELISCLASQ